MISLILISPVFLEATSHASFGDLTVATNVKLGFTSSLRIQHLAPSGHYLAEESELSFSSSMLTKEQGQY